MLEEGGHVERRAESDGVQFKLKDERKIMRQGEEKINKYGWEQQGKTKENDGIDGTDCGIKSEGESVKAVKEVQKWKIYYTENGILRIERINEEKP